MHIRSITNGEHGLDLLGEQEEDNRSPVIETQTQLFPTQALRSQNVPNK